MNFEVEKKELMKGMSFVQAAITGKSTLPIMQGIYIKAENNVLTLIGSDCTTTIQTDILANISENGCVIVDSSLLSSLNKFPDGNISFSYTDKMILNIKSGKVKAKFPILGLEDTFPKTKDITTSRDFKINSIELKSMIEKTIFAAATDDIRPILAGLLFECKDNVFSVVGLDGYRLSIQKKDILSEDFEFVVPSHSLNNLIKIIPDKKDIDIFISYDENNIKFSFDDISLQTRLLEGGYIKYSSLLPIDNDIILEIESKILKESIEGCLIIDKDKNMIRFLLKNNTLEISSLNSTNGEIKEEIDCITTGEIEIAFNGKYIRDVCSSLNGILQIKMKSPITPCLVQLKDIQNQIQLVLPIRITR